MAAAALHTSQHLHPHPSILLSSGARGNLWKLRSQSPSILCSGPAWWLPMSSEQKSSYLSSNTSWASPSRHSSHSDSEHTKLMPMLGPCEARPSPGTPQPLPQPPAACGLSPLPADPGMCSSLSPSRVWPDLAVTWETPPALPRQLQSPSPSPLFHHTEHSLIV